MGLWWRLVELLGRRFGPLARAEGESLADVRLQIDVFMALLIADRVASGPAGETCTGRRIVRVEVLAVPEIDQANILRGPWRERWTLDGCGAEASYVIDFRSRPEGGVNFRIEDIAIPDAPLA